jgi:hypothetical protein
MNIVWAPSNNSTVYFTKDRQYQFLALGRLVKRAGDGRTICDVTSSLRTELPLGRFTFTNI